MANVVLSSSVPTRSAGMAEAAATLAPFNGLAQGVAACLSLGKESHSNGQATWQGPTRPRQEKGLDREQILIRANLPDIRHLRAAFEPQPHPRSFLADWWRPALTHALGAILAGFLTSAFMSLKAEGANLTPQCEQSTAVQHSKPAVLHRR